MKRVIKNDTHEVALLSEINNKSFVGIQFGISSKKCWVINIDGEFQGMAIGDDTDRHNWTKSSKIDYVESALEQSGTQAFVFEDKNELVTWLITE